MLSSSTKLGLTTGLVCEFLSDTLYMDGGHVGLDNADQFFLADFSSWEKPLSIRMPAADPDITEMRAVDFFSCSCKELPDTMAESW